MSKYLFVLGRETALSLAELESVMSDSRAPLQYLGHGVAACEIGQSLDPDILNKLGGAVKMAEVLNEVSGDEDLTAALTADWLNVLSPAGRLDFGVSVYGGKSSARTRIMKHLMAVKKQLSAGGRAVRLVTSREPQLSAVTIVRQGLMKHGFELVIGITTTEIIVAKTLAVQDYRAYGLRDFGRPAADPTSGMLPPKLAQIMLNLARVGTDDILLDPFCGSGTILQEAVLMGVKKIYGSDDDPRAVKNSQENIRWLLKEYPQQQTSVEIIHRDVGEAWVKPAVIVTEPWLGKPLRGRESMIDLQRQLSAAERLYRRAFRQWQKILPAGGRVVMVWPAYIHRQGQLRLELQKELDGLGFRPQPLLKEATARQLGLDDNLVLTYGRPDAMVRREIRRWTLDK